MDGPTGLVTLRFAQRSVWPTLTGVLDPTLLEAQMSGPPNYINVANDGQSGRPGALSGASVSFGGAYSALTKQKSGVVSVAATIAGTQSEQASVLVSLYRDAVSGPSPVQLGAVAAHARRRGRNQLLVGGRLCHRPSTRRQPA